MCVLTVHWDGPSGLTVRWQGEPSAPTGWPVKLSPWKPLWKRTRFQVWDRESTRGCEASILGKQARAEKWIGRRHVKRTHSLPEWAPADHTWEHFTSKKNSSYKNEQIKIKIYLLQLFSEKEEKEKKTHWPSFKIIIAPSPYSETM